MNWVITGGCGFIGLNLVKKLYEEGGHRIKIIDNLSAGSIGNLHKICPTVTRAGSCFTEVEFIDEDITDLVKVRAAAKGADIIVHLAALPGVRESIESPADYIQNNIVGTFNILEASRQWGVPLVINASSGTAVGDCIPPIREDSLPEPISPYGASKLAAEALCHSFNYCYDMNVVSLRFSNVYGPYSKLKTNLIPNFLNAFLSGGHFEIYGDGEQRRDLIYVDDLNDAIRKFAEMDVSGVFQLCTNVEYSVNQIIAQLMNTLRINGMFCRQEDLMYGKEQLGDIQTNWADNSKIKKVLQWEPKISLEEGLQKIVEWFIDENRKTKPV